MQLVNGNPESEPNNPAFLLDESLVPVVAKALELVGYRFIDAASAMGRKGAKDPEIIKWCSDYNAVWVHADDRARKQHRILIQTSGIRTLWVYREGGRMSAKEQLRTLAFILPLFIQEMGQHPRQRHFKASARNPIAKPSLRRVQL